jgi:hypothetical protein
MIAAGLGWWLRNKGFIIGGSLLITVAICLVPLLTYAIEDILGLWPAEYPGAYKDYYPWINGSWIVMELATIVAAAIALRYVRFAFLTAPIAFSFWFLSMDLGRIDVDEQWLRDNARSVCVAERCVYLARGQIAAIDVPGIRSARSALVFGTSCLPGLPRLIFLSLCAGTARFELNSFDSMDAATGSRPHQRISEKIYDCLRFARMYEAP